MQLIPEFILKAMSEEVDKREGKFGTLFREI